jgi:hypothetical protein
MHHPITGTIGIATVGGDQTHGKRIRGAGGIAGLRNSIASAIMQLENLTLGSARIHCGRIWNGVEHGYHQQRAQNPNWV